MEYGEIKFWVHNNEISFTVFKTKKQLIELLVVSMIDVVYEEVNNAMEVDLGSFKLKDPK